MLLLFDHVNIGGGGQVGVTEDRLNVAHRQGFIAAHSHRGGMAQGHASTSWSPTPCSHDGIPRAAPRTPLAAASIRSHDYDVGESTTTGRVISEVSPSQPDTASTKRTIRGWRAAIAGHVSLCDGRGLVVRPSRSRRDVVQGSPPSVPRY